MMMIRSKVGQNLLDAENAMQIAERGMQGDQASQALFERRRLEFIVAARTVVSELHLDGFRPGREGD